MIDRQHRCWLVALLALLTTLPVAAGAQQKFSQSNLASPAIAGPISVYDNWST